MQLAPADTTTPEYRPVRYSGATQLKPSSTFYTFSLRNSTFAMPSKMRRSVKTFSKMMTVLPEQEQLMWEKKML
jgi:hypothetical protein